MKGSLTLIRRLALGLSTTLALTLVHAEEPGTIKVGATATGAPFTFLDLKTGSIQGMMIDSIEAAAKAAGLTVEIQQNSFAALIPSLTAEKIDVISAGMLKTEERAKVVDFSDPVYAYGEGLLVAADDQSRYPDLAALKGQVIGVQAGTTFYDMLVKLGIFSEVRTYDSVADMARDIAVGRVKAGIGDQPILAYQIQQKAFRGVKLAEGYQPSRSGDVCFVVRKGDTALRDRLNKAIATLKADGTLKTIQQRWGI